MYHVSAQGVDERMINVHYYYNCFKGNAGDVSERRGGAHMGFSERIDTILH